jgi:hypothetical protein
MRALLLAVVLAGCVEAPRHASRLMCHNSNCAYSDPARDDTLHALRESLELELDGRSLIDGTEIDLIWEPSSGRCVFEHDHADAITAPDADRAFDVLAGFLRARRERAAWNGEEFALKIELKAGAAPDARPLDAEEAVALASCGSRMADRAEAAASEAGIRLVVMFESEEVSQLRALREVPGWRPDNVGRRLPRQLAVNGWREVEGLASDIGVITLGWKEASDGDYARFRAQRDRGVDLMIWGFDATGEALAVFDYIEPTYINANEAPLLRRWIEAH